MDFTRLLDRIYGENDFARNVATSLAGVASLTAYLIFDDWVIAGLTGAIVFPIGKVVTLAIVRAGSTRRATRTLDQATDQLFDRLSDDEKAVVLTFVEHGGTSLTWGRLNNLHLNDSAVETLIQRKLMWVSMTADGMTETFAIDTGIFDAAIRSRPSPKTTTRQLESSG